VRLLIIEDYAPLRELLARGLRDAGYAVDATGEGGEGLWFAENHPYDVIILDVMLPGVDGFEILRTLRKAGSTTHVLVLTARDAVADRVTGLDLGADDYLVKPFAFSELAARVKALGRRPRATAATTTVLRVADLELDLIKRTVRRAGQPIALQPREFRLLEYLMRHAGEVVTRTMLLENVWDYHFDPRTNIVESHLSRLRTKVEKGFAPELIHTLRGAGYCLREPG